MQHEYDCIEQLDLAAQQLASVSPSQARFAMILTDNVVELMLYHKCRDTIVQDDGYFSYGKQYGGEHKYNAKTRAEVLGRKFDERPKFCRQLGILNEPEVEFILTAHRYRNEVYHVGVLHNDILYAIAWQYHQLACDIFERLAPLHKVWASHDVVSAAVARHTGAKGLSMTNVDEHVRTVTTSLKSAKPQLEPSFAAQLKEGAVRRVERIGSALEFIVETVAKSEKDVIADLEFHDFLHGEDSGFLEDLAAVTTEEEYSVVCERARAAWSPKFVNSPVSRWMERAASLDREDNPLSAFKKFQSLLTEIEAFSQLVIESAQEIENMVQLHADVARGK